MGVHRHPDGPAMTTTPAILHVLFTTAMLLAATHATAQRSEPTYAWQKRTIRIDHGRPPYGKHGLDELAPGTSWRLGSNNATTMDLELPLVASGRTIVPGEYRIALFRAANGTDFELQFDFASRALGRDAGALTLPAGSVTKVEKPSEELVLEFVEPEPAAPDAADRRTQSEPATHDVVLRITFGPHRLDAPLTMVAVAEPIRVGRHQLLPFRLAAAHVASAQEKSEPVALAGLHPRREPSSRKEPPFFHLVLTGDELEIVPALRAPDGFFGFGELEPYAPEWTTSGSVEWLTRDQEVDRLAVTEADVSRKGELTVTFAYGSRLGTATVAIPRGPR